MLRSSVNLQRLWRFLWLVLAWSVLTAPQSLGGEPLVTFAEHYATSRPGDDEPQQTLLAPPLPLPTTPAIPAAIPSAAQPALSDSAWRPQYWFVSSRESAQHPRDWNGCPLDVTWCPGDGRIYQSSLPHMLSQLTPETPVLICVHGSFVTVEDNLVESSEAFQAIRGAAPHLPLHVIFYSWPSDGPYLGLAPVDIGIRGHRADYNGFHVAWLLAQIPEHHPVCLFGHSHGCRVVMSTLQLISGGSVEGYRFAGNVGPQRRIRVVMAAAAFDHHWLNPGQRFDRALWRVEALLNLQNRRDLPLLFYPLTRPFAHRAMARTGLTWRDRTKLGPAGCKAVDCDVTSFLGREHYWPEYYSRPQIMATAAPYLYFQSP
ncbi:MAG: alpha/beta hydrolase [Planctomyces sp.]|nr:alpha/beta hydrolase [Planctomyces sp.]